MELGPSLPEAYPCPCLEMQGASWVVVTGGDPLQGWCWGAPASLGVGSRGMSNIRGEWWFQEGREGEWGCLGGL